MLRVPAYRLLVLLFALALGWLSAAAAKADTYVRGYVRSDGTYVPPHFRSESNGNFFDNWTTWPNVNPYTSRIGTKLYPPLGYGSDVFVRSYLRDDGSYVPPHYRSAPDGNSFNNWSTLGNVNPYTSEIGTRLPEPVYDFDPLIPSYETFDDESDDATELGVDSYESDDSNLDTYDYDDESGDAEGGDDGE